MNDSDLERQLRVLQPAAPSPDLELAIARELSTSALAVPAFPRSGAIPRPRRENGAWRWVRDLAWAGAGAAAALVAAAYFSTSAPPRETSAVVPLATSDAAFEPAGVTSELLASDESGQVFETDEGPVREVRYSFRERHAWMDPRTGARMEFEVPRQDVYRVPVSLQ